MPIITPRILASSVDTVVRCVLPKIKDIYMFCTVLNIYVKNGL